MTIKLVRRAVAAALVVILAVGASSAGAAPEQNPDAVVLADFTARIDKYLELHQELAEGAAELKETEDPARIREAQQRLAARIRAARNDAAPGDIFTADIRTKFRQLMYPEVKGAEGRRTRATIKEDAPRSLTLKVNAPYPEGAPLPTVPPSLLRNLPLLPEELEYRIVGKHLILRDVAANIIVDYIPNAIE